MNRNAWSRPGIAALGLLALAAPARAGAQVLEQELPAPQLEAVEGVIGVRTTLIRSAGFDPFSGNDVLPQLSLAVEHPLWRQNAVAVAMGVALDYGEADAEARGIPSTFSVWRLSALAEGRYYLWPFAYGFVRFAPGLLRGAADLADDSSPTGAKLEDHFDLLSADGSVGAALRLTASANPVGAWITAEGGYGWAQSHRLVLAPAASPKDEAKLAPIDLGVIAPRGAFMRFALAVTY